MNTLWCEVAMQVVQTHDTKRRGIEIFGGTDNQLAARAESHQPRRVSGQPLHVKALAFPRPLAHIPLDGGTLCHVLLTQVDEEIQVKLWIVDGLDMLRKIDSSLLETQAAEVAEEAAVFKVVGCSNLVEAQLLHGINEYRHDNRHDDLADENLIANFKEKTPHARVLGNYHRGVRRSKGRVKDLQEGPTSRERLL